MVLSGQRNDQIIIDKALLKAKNHKESILKQTEKVKQL
jgi:hypothetical protein